MSVGGLCHWRRAGSLHRCVIGVALKNSKATTSSATKQRPGTDEFWVHCVLSNASFTRPAVSNGLTGSCDVPCAFG